MMGNVWEWNETWVTAYRRGLRGAAYGSDGDLGIKSSDWGGHDPGNEYGGVGFRVASVPEPCSLVLLSLGGLALLRKRRQL